MSGCLDVLAQQQTESCDSLQPFRDPGLVKHQKRDGWMNNKTIKGDNNRKLKAKKQIYYKCSYSLLMLLIVEKLFISIIAEGLLNFSVINCKD